MVLKCEYCNETFPENLMGLNEKTFHELLHEPQVSEDT